MGYEHRLTSKSQVTVPLDVRTVLGVRPGGVVRFEIDNGTVTLKPGISDTAHDIAFEAALKKWGGKYAVGKSTDEQMRDLRSESKL